MTLAITRRREEWDGIVAVRQWGSCWTCEDSSWGEWGEGRGARCTPEISICFLQPPPLVSPLALRRDLRANLIGQLFSIPIRKLSGEGWRPLPVETTRLCAILFFYRHDHHAVFTVSSNSGIKNINIWYSSQRTGMITFPPFVSQIKKNGESLETK